MQKHQLQKLPHFVSELMREIRALTQRDAQAYRSCPRSREATGRASSWSFSTRYRSMVVENGPFLLFFCDARIPPDQ